MAEAMPFFLEPMTKFFGLNFPCFPIFNWTTGQRGDPINLGPTKYSGDIKITSNFWGISRLFSSSTIYFEVQVQNYNDFYMFLYIHSG